MDPQHEADLSRILDNRRKRGVRQSTPQASPLGLDATSMETTMEPFSLSSGVQLQPSLDSRPIAEEGTQMSPRPSFTMSAGAAGAGTRSITRTASAPNFAPQGYDEERPPMSAARSFTTAGSRSVGVPTVPASQVPPSAMTGGGLPSTAPPLSPKVSHAEPTQPAPPGTLTTQLLKQQTTLQQQQNEQKRQLESMQNELKKGLADVTQAIKAQHSPAHPQQGPHYGLTQDRRAQFTVDSSTINERLGGLQRALHSHGDHVVTPTSGGGSATNRSRAVRFSTLANQNPLDSVPTQMPRNVPIPVIFDENRGTIQASPRAVRFPGEIDETAAAEEYEAALARAPKEPGPLPSQIQPFTTSTIDIASSVTILRSGDWFLKWNAKGNHVSPRYLWLDTQKNVISWGREKGAASMLSGYIRVEEILEVTTEQMSELGADDVPRVYYVMVLHTSHRRLQIATERREKMNTWYDALNNIALFYRVRGTQSHAYEESTE